MATDFEVVQAAVDGLDPTSEKVLKALGLQPAQAQVFWVGLRAASDDLVIATYLQAAKASKVVKTPSPYINQLRKAKLIKAGSDRGNWVITAKAVTKLRKLLGEEGEEPETESSDASEEADTEAGKGAEAPEPVDVGLTGPVGELVNGLKEYLETLDRDIAEMESRVKEKQAEGVRVRKTFANLVGTGRK